tara:strand:- start:2987 stop:3604 length:618 start_codon:yes stop_codon:yes gene_type:complete
MSNLNVNNLTPLAGVGGTIGVSGSLDLTGSITLAGNVTAQRVYGTQAVGTEYIQNTTGTTTYIVLGDTVQLLKPFIVGGHTYVSGHITSSMTVRAEHLYSTDDAFIEDNLTVGDTLTVGNIGTSAISASGGVTASGISTHGLVVGGATNLAGIPHRSSPLNGISQGQSGDLYTLSGSQIFSSSAWTSGFIMDGSISASLFVFQRP